ncbi:hypothetical protein B0I37DRAFT_430200 [Chaetomium sp. MPI-CAGE-AT-0009]|nr:hypothetical protein B0I37DRAFT_430200 [Chaetomium sp. MPI-CAGE-AT-0009]
METIHESKQHTAGPSGRLPEAALFSVVKPNPWTTDVVVSAAVDGLTGRASSLKTPLAKKASFRVPEWAKRSNSSRTAATTGMTPSESLKSHIKHLGGGRLEQVQVRGTANNTTLVAPPPMRTLRQRASSIESRSTQWLDFYTGSPEPNKPQSQPLPKFPLSADAPRQRERAESNPSLRPAPLRVPSSKRQNNPSRAAAGTPPPVSNPLVRKNSNWKPLPHLPALRGGTGTTNELITPPHKQQDSDPAYPAFVPVFRFDSAPPTPDSSTGIAAFGRTHTGNDQNKDAQKPAENTQQRTPPLTGRAPTLDPPNPPQPQPRSHPNPNPNFKPNPKPDHKPEPEPSPKRQDSRTQRPPPKPKAHKLETLPETLPPRHTRQERVWLHVNYRGEAPFLQAWGLEIGKVEDRVEGVGILRDLMRAEMEEEESDFEEGKGGGRNGDRNGVEGGVAKGDGDRDGGRNRAATIGGEGRFGGLGVLI